LSHIVLWSERHELPLAIHLAETKEETEFLSGKTGPIAERIFPAAKWRVDDFSDLPANSSVQWLINNAVLPAGSLVVHGVHLTEADINDVARYSWHVVLCPRSNSHFGDSRAAVASYRKAGINLALGTDSRASVSSLSLWDELAYAWRHFPGVCGPSEWLDIATRGGAKALGVDAIMGRLEPGLGANFQIVVPPEIPSTGELAEALCAHADMIDVKALYIDGENILSVN
jgi:cytosine/adenosine deaminase-related metal-dependent hydrolase